MAFSYSFPSFEPVLCSMSSSNCCFLTCIQVSQETGKTVWYSHLFKNFPQFVVTHTVKAFSIVSEVEIDVFLEFHCFLCGLANVDSFISGSSAFSGIDYSVSLHIAFIIISKYFLDSYGFL